MRIEKGKLYAVITGDIVNSSKLPSKQRQRLHHVMREGSKAILKAFKESVPLEVDIFRGDSWQLLVTDPSKSLRIGLFYRAYLRAWMGTSRLDTRMSIAVGTVDFVPDDRVSRGDGQAYQYSGSALGEMVKASNMSLRFPEQVIEEPLDILIQLVDAMAMNWSGKQALAVTGALEGWKQEKIGSLWKPPITQQSVNRHLQRAGWFPVERAIRFFEKQLSEAVR